MSLDLLRRSYSPRRRWPVSRTALSATTRSGYFCEKQQRSRCQPPKIGGDPSRWWTEHWLHQPTQSYAKTWSTKDARRNGRRKTHTQERRLGHPTEQQNR